MKPEIKQILYATDLSENARHAFGYAADLAVKYDAKVTILYVMESMNHMVENQVKEMLGKEKWEQIKSEKHDTVVEKIQGRLEEFCSEMDSHFESCRLLVNEIRIKKGIPAEEILLAGKDIAADLIVMGSHGHNLIQTAFMGGTAKKVLQGSAIPVLVIRLPE